MHILLLLIIIIILILIMVMIIIIIQLVILTDNVTHLSTTRATRLLQSACDSGLLSARSAGERRVKQTNDTAKTHIYIYIYIYTYTHYYNKQHIQSFKELANYLLFNNLFGDSSWAGLRIAFAYTANATVVQSSIFSYVIYCIRL